MYETELKTLNECLNELVAVRDTFGESVKLYARSDGKMFIRYKRAGRWHLIYVKKSDRARIIADIARIGQIEAVQHQIKCFEVLRMNEILVQELTKFIP